MTEYAGSLVYPIQPLLSPGIDDGSRTAKEQTGLDRGSANKVYPIQPDLSPAMDDGDLTKYAGSGLPRGVPLPPYNANVRGLGKRVDQKQRIEEA